MKTVKTIAAVVLALVAALMIAFAVAAVGSGNIFNIVFSVIVAAVCIFGAVKLSGMKPFEAHRKKPEPEPIKPYAPAQQPQRILIETKVTYKPDKPEQPSGYPRKRGYYIAYHYEDVQIASRDRYTDIQLEPGSRLKFVPEPDNQYDSAAVAIYKGPDKVGYMYRGRLQDMTHDFIERGDSVAGIVVSDDFGKCIYNIAFYKKEDIE